MSRWISNHLIANDYNFVYCTRSGWNSIFFKAARMFLHFESVTKTIFLTHQCFGYCWAVLAQQQCFLLSYSVHQRVCWVYIRSWEGTQPGQLTQTDQWDIPSLAQQWKLKGEDFGEVAIAQILDGYPSPCERRWVIAFAFFALLSFVFSSFFTSPIKLFILTNESSHFCSSDTCLCCAAVGEIWASSCVVDSRLYVMSVFV